MLGPALFPEAFLHFLDVNQVDEQLQTCPKGLRETLAESHVTVYWKPPGWPLWRRDDVTARYVALKKVKRPIS